jgi:type IV pilus assembly protein PilX
MLAQYAQTRAMPLRASQTGVVMVITLIVLVAMTLAAIALVRSVDTTNVIAGNLAFKQATVNSADRGTEAAVAWLEAAGNSLYNDHPLNGYTSKENGDHPGPGKSWDFYWNNTIAVTNPQIFLCEPTNCNQDAAGNVVSYTIHRLCLLANTPPGALNQYCSASPSSFIVDSSQGSGTVVLDSVNLTYYRITIRVAGPRNTVSYVQTVVAL